MGASGAKGEELTDTVKEQEVTGWEKRSHRKSRRTA